MTILRSIILFIGIILLSSPSSSSVVLGFDLDSDSMPYDMSAVEQMERIQQFTQNQQMKETMTLLETHEQQRDNTAEPSSVQYAPVLNDPLTTEEQAFFSERDVDAFLEQRSKQQLAAQAKVEAAAKAEAEIEAQRRANAKAAAEATLRAAQEEKERHERMIKETLEHPIEAANFAFDHLMPRPAFLEAESEFKQGLEQLQEHKLEEGQEQEFDLDLDVGAEVQGESEVDTTADDSAEVEHEQKAEAESDSESKSEPAALVESKSKTVSTVDMESPEAMRLAREHFAEVEQAGLKALRRIEFMAKLKARDSPQGSAKESQHDQAKPMSFAETRAKSRSSSTASQPWWSSKAGVSSNFQHYRQGVKNSLLQVGSSTKNGQVPNAAGSYSLPLGKSVGAARLNQKKVPAQMAAPVQAYPVIPVQEQGSSLAFNPYSGAEFHPPIAVPAHAPKLPEYMAESQQPFAGAGYYGSGGGQGPHPGSEAFLPLPGVSGKEFGIRAREAWEEHAQKYANDPTGFHNVANQPQYPYFPAWSRESEIGGRPDIFPKPMYNLPTVNKIAQAAGEAAYHHSQLYYPQLNRPITTPAPFVDAARAESVVGTAGISPSAASVPIRGYRQPRLIRAVTGYPRPEARTSWSGTIPEQFPQPLDSNTFDENVNYAPMAPRPTLGVPHMPAQFPLRNIMVNSGPDKGLHPIYGGFPQYIPVPVAARAENDVVAAH